MRSPLHDDLRAKGADFVEEAGALVARSFGDPANEYLALRRGVGLSDLSHMGMVSVSGPERLSFLESLLSQELSPLEEAGVMVPSLLLEPRGKVQFGVMAFSRPDDIVLVTETGQGEALSTALNRWRIRVKCEVAPVPGLGLLEARGPGAAPMPGVGWDWPGLPGRLSLVDGGEVAARWRSLAGRVTPVGSAAREAVRIEAGVPRIGPGLDADETTIPQEAFLERDMVSFTKGCFVGQELVCRIDTRGHVNRYLRGLVVGDSVLPPRGADVEHEGKSVGRVTGVAESLDLRAPVALAYVRRNVDLPAPVTIKWDGGSAAAEARELPLIGGPHVSAARPS